MFEFTEDLFGYDEALGGDARLPVVDRSRGHRGLDRFIEIRARHHDERIAAAKLQHRLLDGLSRDACDVASGGLAPGQRDGGDTRIFDDPIDLIRRDQQGLKDSFMKAGPMKNFFDCQRTSRHVRSMLEQADEPEYLPKRKVPRHHGQHRTDRLIANVAGAGLYFYWFIAQEFRSPLRIEAAAQGTFHRFLHRGFDGLAHFLSHRYREFLLFIFENFCGAHHFLSAFGERSSPMPGEGFSGK